MIAFRFSFPAGRYHATPWGRHVNEAEVAWPPEPVRVLRALVATWWRKADHEAFPKARLDDLIDALAAEPPVYKLPEAVHTHIRAFMPAPEAKRLIFDAFLKVRNGDEMIVAWPTMPLEPDQQDLAQHLLERMGYLGRAESWVEAGIAHDWDGDFNAEPRGADSQKRGRRPVDVTAPLSKGAWKAERARQLTAASRLKGAKAKQLIATLPERLSDAIAVDTGEWQAVGWSSPPALRRVVYDRPEVGPLPPTRSGSARRKQPDPPREPRVARFLLAGRPAPQVEETLRIAEVLRAALMSGFPKGHAPLEFLGRDADGPLRDDPEHAHAFYLPEDADGDGRIDHLIVYSRTGFTTDALRALDRLTELYVGEPRPRRDATSTEAADADPPPDSKGRREWRLALDHVGPPCDFADSPLIGDACVWDSATPYLNPRHAHGRALDDEARLATYREALLREWRLRFPGAKEPEVAAIRPEGGFAVPVRPGSFRSTLHFARTRSRGRGGEQPDAAGAALRLTFDRPVPGPFAFGKHAHFGMGLFRRPIAP